MSTTPTRVREGGEPIVDPEAFDEHAEDLDEDCNLFICDKEGCGHYAGDPRPHNFYARCPGCGTLVRFRRIIE